MDERNYNRRYAKEYGWRMSLFYRWFLYFVVWPVGLLQYNVRVKHMCSLKRNERYIFAGNHTSFLDPPFVALAANRKVAFMAKKELFTDKNGLLRFIVKNLGGFAVNRENPEIATFKTVLDLLKTDWSFGIFPEGQIRHNHVVENLQKGIVTIAKKAKMDIVPVGIKGFDGYAGKTLFKKHISVVRGTPISYELSEEEILSRWAEQICEYTGYENGYKQNDKAKEEPEAVEVK